MRRKEACRLKALALNRDVLARGEQLIGKSHSKLTKVLAKIAQNLHGLGRKEEAEPFSCAFSRSRMPRVT